MFSLVSALLVAALGAASVNAHGYVQDVVVGSTHWTGYLPYNDVYENPQPKRIIRAIPGNGTFADLLSSTLLYLRFLLGPVTDLTLIE